MKKLFAIMLLTIICKINSICSDRSPANINSGWINMGRQLIQCYESGNTEQDTFVTAFRQIQESFTKKIDNLSTVPTPSDDLKDEKITSDITQITNSKLYNFLKQPYYNILINKYGMGTQPNYQDDYKQKLSWLCTMTQDLPIIHSPDKSIGSPTNFKFGNIDGDNETNNICGLNSSLYPVLVGWAERNIAPNPIEFKNNYNDYLYHGAKTISGETGKDSFLVGDPNCPPVEETHFYGCRVCDQFLSNGQSTAAYKFCQFGYNWAHPLMWYGNGCTSVNRKNICVDGLNLLLYLYTWIVMWWNQGSWPYLDYTGNRYAPIPATYYDLYWQWGKNGINSGSDDAYSYSTANITDCMSAGKNNICDDQERDNQNKGITNLGNYNNIYDNLLCLKNDWKQPDLPGWYCGFDCSYTLLSKNTQPYGGWDENGPALLKEHFKTEFNKAGEGSENYCDRNSVFFPLIVGWAERNIANHPEVRSDADLFIKAPMNITDSDGRPKIYQHLVGSSSCPESEFFEGCRVCDQFINSSDYQLCQWGFNFNRPLAWISNGAIRPDDQSDNWAWLVNREGSLLKWFDHYWATINSDYLCPGQKCDFSTMKIPTPHFKFGWLNSLWGKKGYENNTNAGGIANIMHYKTAGAPDSLKGWDCSKFQNSSNEVYLAITQAEIDELDKENL